MLYIICIYIITKLLYITKYYIIITIIVIGVGLVIIYYKYESHKLLKY